MGATVALSGLACGSAHRFGSAGRFSFNSVSADNFAPAGFVPGSRHETAWTWFALVGGLIGLIAIGVLVERALSR